MSAKDKKAEKEPVVQEVHTHNLGFIQRDFINPKNLGFMKVVLLLFAADIIFKLISMAVLMKDAYIFDFSNSMSFVNVVCETVSFWLLWRRKKVARWWIIIVSVFNITLGAVFNYLTGSFTITGQLIISLTDIVLILYFLFAKRPKVVLNQEFSLETYKREAESDRNYFRPKTWPFWRNLIMYFCVFSVVGHWMEAAYCTLIRFGILPGVYDPNSQIWSDWLYPFLVYGFGVVACVLIFYPLKIFLQKRITGGWKANLINVFITFVVAGIVCCLIELVMGLTMNMDYSLWDYRDMFCNFMGQICLQNGIAFGMVATLMTWVIYPALEGVLAKVPKEIGNGIFIAIVIAFALLWLLYCFQPPKEVQQVVTEATQGTETGSELDQMSLEQLPSEANKAVIEAREHDEIARGFLKDGKLQEAQKELDAATECNKRAESILNLYSEKLGKSATVRVTVGE